MPSELTASTVAKLENRRMALSVDYLLEIAGVFQVPPADLIFDGGNATRLLPVIVHAAMGSWGNQLDMSEDVMPVPAHLTGPNLFAVRQEGDALRGLLPSGSGGFVVIDPDQRELIDESYYAINSDEGVTFFAQFSSSPLSLKPCGNGVENKAILVGTAPFVVLGRVVYVGQSL